jgi:hypothetical protein
VVTIVISFTDLNILKGVTPKIGIMSTESILAEIAAVRSDIKSLAKIVRKIKATQDDPTGEKSSNRARNNGFNREQNISEELRVFLRSFRRVS